MPDHDRIGAERGEGPSGVTVVIQGTARPFGILGAHSVTRRELTVHDIHYIQAIANVLATAILVISLLLLAVGTLYRRKRIDV